MVYTFTPTDIRAGCKPDLPVRLELRAFFTAAVSITWCCIQHTYATKLCSQPGFHKTYSFTKPTAQSSGFIGVKPSFGLS